MSYLRLPAHSLSIDQLVEKLNLGNPQSGLGPKEVSLRQQEFGYNDFEEEAEEPLWKRVYSSLLENHLILLLFGSAVLSAFLGHVEDAISITLAIVIVFTVGFVQEYRSEKSLEALKKLAPPHCQVIREGKNYHLLARELVVGDLIQFQTGDRIPADARLVESSDLEVDQSSLTGETEPHSKTHNTIIGDDVPVSDRENIVYMGTLVSNGSGKAIVYSIAKDSQFGQVVELLQDMTQKKTPLQEAMDDLGRQLSYASFVVIGIIFLIGLVQGRPLRIMFNIGVSLAVAAIPEGLPVVVMVTLALGVLRMSRKRVIIKRLPAVETLGSVNVLCVDKTGTLTENRMTVSSIYSAHDDKTLHTETNVISDTLSPSQLELCMAANLCNSSYKNSAGIWVGQSTDVGLMQLCDKLSLEDQRTVITRLSEVTFNSERKWMSVKCSNQVTYFKGALEPTLARCTKLGLIDHNIALDDSTRARIVERGAQMASSGLRVIALASTTDPGLNPREVSNLIFLGLVGMRDPPRPSIAPTLEWLRKASVKVVMITGDAEETARCVADSIGMTVNRSSFGAVSGSQLDSLSDMELSSLVTNTTIYYRTTPHQKMRIVRALQSRDCIVAMTGDGVNDAPALKIADIGIAMGNSGTDVAREAADVVLVDDDLGNVISAIEEGKSIFANIQCFITFQLSTSVAALTLITISTSLGYSNPLNAMQILWINILMDGPPAQSLGVEPADPEAMLLPPRPRNQAILERSILYRIALNAVLVVAGTLYVYIRESRDGEVTARDTTMTFTCFVLFDMFNALSCRSLFKPLLLPHSRQSRPVNWMFVGSVSGSLLGHMFVVYVPFFQRIFQTEALTFGDWWFLILLSSSIFIINDVLKYYLSQQKQAKREAEDGLLTEMQDI